MIHPDGDDREPPYLAACCEAHTDWITVEQWNRRQSLESVREEVLEEEIKQRLGELEITINKATNFRAFGDQFNEKLWLTWQEAKAEEEKCRREFRLLTKILAALQSPARVAEDERIYTKADMEAACALVLAGFRSKPVLDKMVDRFLAWPLPDSVCTDPIATKQGPGRIGTNLLNATEARQMLEHVLTVSAPESPAKDDKICKSCRGSGTVKGMTYGQGPDDHEIDVTCPDCNGTGESPAKEQPGEQNAAPAGGGIQPVDSENAVASVGVSGRQRSPARHENQATVAIPAAPQVAAPDAAAMVRRLHELAELKYQHHTIHVPAMLREAAALIEKLGQGWIPVGRGLPIDGLVLATDGKEVAIYTVGAVIEYAKAEDHPLTHWMPLPPPPERP